MIAGVGVDMIELPRIRRALARHGTRLCKRILSPDERQAAHADRVSYLAGRFAAKEAALKALGTGLRGGMRWHSVEILAVPGGAPRLRTSGAASNRLREMGITATHISITHTREHAVALVVMEARSPR